MTSNESKIEAILDVKEAVFALYDSETNEARKEALSKIYSDLQKIVADIAS